MTWRETWNALRQTTWRQGVACLGVYVAYHVTKGGIRDRSRELHLIVEAMREIEVAKEAQRADRHCLTDWSIHARRQ